jgi:peptide-methionine (R)-S-oxide reductase
MREHGTERPGSCALNFEKRAGTFICAGCDQPLFVSKKKFESGTGWPSFNDPEKGSVETTSDRTFGMVRTEVHCSRCGSHLGHVFPTARRRPGSATINGVAMVQTNNCDLANAAVPAIACGDGGVFAGARSFA